MDSLEKKKNKRISAVHIIPASFLIVIIIGTLLLMLPVMSAPGRETDIITAAFTSTTSVCVTGLVVDDTYAHWSMAGQILILILVQIGGLGVIAVGASIMLVGKRRFSFGDLKLLGDSLNIEKNKELLQFLKRILRGVFLVEFIGAVLYAVRFVPMFGWKKGIWASLFQAVSAFCNAGMDVIGPNSMMDFQDSYYLMGVTMILIVLGGLGFVVWFDLIDTMAGRIKGRWSGGSFFDRLSVHSKLVLVMTVTLIISGTVIIFISEFSNPGTVGGMSLPEKILNSMFQSVTFRTAGFASIPQDKLTETTCLVGYLLMFISGSPVGTAGGIKTVTIFLVFMNAVSYINGKKENVIFHRRVSQELMRKAAAIVFVSISAVLVMCFLLMSFEKIPLTDALYEVVSALATVGLSRGLTPNLGAAGRIIIIISMYLGRIGPISMAFFFSKNSGTENRIYHAEGTFYVG